LIKHVWNISFSRQAIRIWYSRRVAVEIQKSAAQSAGRELWWRIVPALLSPTCMILSASKHKGRELAPTAGGVPTGTKKAEAETKAFISAYSRMFLSKIQ